MEKRATLIIGCFASDFKLDMSSCIILARNDEKVWREFFLSRVGSCNKKILLAGFLFKILYKAKPY